MSQNPIQETESKPRVWRPHPGPQTEAFRYYWVNEILYGGAKGGGKTDWLLFDFCKPELLAKPNYKGIIFRRTYPRLREIIERSFLWFFGQAKYDSQEHRWTFPSRAKLYFGHCQHEESKYDYQGQEYHYEGFDQLEEFNLTQYEFLKAQARSTDPDIPVRIRATANPGNVGHVWVKQRFIDNKIPYKIYRDKFNLTSIFIPAKVYDNPSLMLNDPMYVKRLESLPEQDRRALLDGDWNIFFGQFFREWRTDTHIVEPYFIPSQMRRFIAGDYGFHKPASIGWYAINENGKLTRYRELYKENLHYDTLAKEILDLTGDEKIEYAVFDPAIFGDKQHHEEAKESKPGAEIMQDVIGSKFPIVRGDNRRDVGWANVRKYLNNGLFEVFSTCINFIRTIPANIHSVHKPEDLDTDGEDHTADELRYACASRPGATDISQRERENSISPWNRLQERLRDQEQGRIYA